MQGRPMFAGILLLLRWAVGQRGDKMYRLGIQLMSEHLLPPFKKSYSISNSYHNIARSTQSVNLSVISESFIDFGLTWMLIKLVIVIYYEIRTLLKTLRSSSAQVSVSHTVALALFHYVPKPFHEIHEELY